MNIDNKISRENEYLEGDDQNLQIGMDSLGDVMNNLNNTEKETNIEQEFSEGNKISKSLNIAAAIIFIAGFIAGFALQQESDFNFVILMICWTSAFFSGIIFLGFAEIINLLQKLVDKE